MTRCRRLAWRSPRSSEIGLENLVGQSRAWISVSPEFLSPDLARNLPPDRVVLQLGAGAFGDQSRLNVFEELRAAGYQLALDQFRYQPGLEPVLRMVDFVKVDMAALGARELAHQSFELKPFDVRLVAQKVETFEDFRLARAAGADLFQGFFFCRPHLVGARAILPSRIALMQLASALQDPTIQLADLEQLISADVGLSYRLLKYINSAYFGLRGRISSKKQATALLGIANLRPWATLTTLADLGDKPRELFVTALIRARFCEQAGQAKDGSPAERFTLGLFSVLDALTDVSMHTALQTLPLTPIDPRRSDSPHRSGPSAGLRDGDRTGRVRASRRDRRWRLAALSRSRCLEQRQGQAADRLSRSARRRGAVVVGSRLGSLLQWDVEPYASSWGCSRLLCWPEWRSPPRAVDRGASVRRCT